LITLAFTVGLVLHLRDGTISLTLLVEILVWGIIHEDQEKNRGPSGNPIPTRCEEDTYCGKMGQLRAIKTVRDVVRWSTGHGWPFKQ